MSETTERKICSKCGIEKSLGDFYFRKDTGSYRNECKPCNLKTKKEYRDSNPELMAKAHRDYYERNREAVIESNKTYYWENSTAIAIHRKSHYEENKDVILAQQREYYSENKDVIIKKNNVYYWNNRETCLVRQSVYTSKNRARCNVHSSARRAVERRATPVWADIDIMERIYSLSREQSALTGVLHHVDHIVPLKHPLVCGLHTQENLRVITSTKNLSKSNKFDLDAFDNSIPNELQP